MPEHQEIEWKESWRDEYLKWLCGYANAHGGTLLLARMTMGMWWESKTAGSYWRIYLTKSQTPWVSLPM